MTIKKVAIIGANGHLGPSVLQALVESNSFDLTVLSRASSKSQYSKDVQVVHLPDKPSTEDYVNALKGQDALVTTFAGSNSDLQINLADAAVKAGVQRFIPADFGSCDSSSPKALDLVPLYKQKQTVRQHLQKLAAEGSLTWTSLVCGHFFDHGLETTLLQFDVRARKAPIFDKGEVKFSATNLATIGKAVVAVLKQEDATKNRMLFIESFNTTQNEILKSLKAATGDENWKVEQLDSGEYIKETKAKLDRNPNDSEATENLVSVVGIIDSNWEGKEDLANELLGLAKEDMDASIRSIVEGLR